MKDKNPNIRQDRAKLYRYANGDAFTGKSMTEVFSDIFRAKIWDEQGTKESVSGIGSSISQTQTVVEKLPDILQQYDIQSVLDIPCGDFYWMQQLDWSSSTYTGADIVEDLVHDNQTKYGTAHIQFIHLDLTQDLLPVHDLIICRDCLVHFSWEDIKKAIQNIKRSHSHYLLTTTFTEQILNEDITTGGWRPLNLEKAPFFFPKPVAIINEGCTEMDGAFRDKSLGLWKIPDLSYPFN